MNLGQRGRQNRSSQLTPSMYQVVCRFSHIVGAPNIVEPAGFRDFREWSARLGAHESRPVWDELIATVARDVSCDINAVNALKEDVVREIIKCVVTPRPEESAKLVSTNAGRQATRPKSSTTLMIVLEQQLERVMNALSQLAAEVPPPSPGSDEAVDAFFGGFHDDRSPMRQTSMGLSIDKLPAVSDILGDRCSSSRSAGLLYYRDQSRGKRGVW